MIDAGFSGQGAPGMAIVIALESLLDSFDDLNNEEATTRAESQSTQSADQTDASNAVRGFVRLFVAMHGDCDGIARAIGCSYHTASRFRRNFGLPSMPRLLTASHHMMFERILVASDEDLANWGNAMRRYWQARPSRGPMGAGLAEFLRISEA